MTPQSTALPPVLAIREAKAGPPKAPMPLAPVLGRLAVTAAVLLPYIRLRTTIIDWLGESIAKLTGRPVDSMLLGIGLVAVLIVALFFIWRRVLAKDKRFHAPLLITSILIMGDTAFSILENHPSQWLYKMTGGVISTYSPTFVAIITAAVAELLLGRFYYGRWPHLASAYVSGISAGILVKSPDVWTFVFCALISITSKYVLRVQGKHLWNPTNFGMTVMLWLAPQHMAALSVQAGNEIWAPAIIFFLGGMILWNLGLVHIPLAFVLTFVPLAILRCNMMDHHWKTELAPMTSPMFELFIFFMITDPKTITRSKRSQVVVAVLVGITDAILRHQEDVYSLFHSLFIVGPIANLVEMAYFARLRRTQALLKPA
jgi:enediyne biosynthesis protein E5